MPRTANTLSAIALAFGMAIAAPAVAADGPSTPPPVPDATGMTPMGWATPAAARAPDQAPDALGWVKYRPWSCLGFVAADGTLVVGVTATNGTSHLSTIPVAQTALMTICSTKKPYWVNNVGDGRGGFAWTAISVYAADE